MTTTIAWTSYQNERPSALTFASDSRLTWSKRASKWDFGRKIFWCKNSPDIFGFAGDVVSQSTIISQACEIFDYSTSVLGENNAKDRHDVFLNYICSGIDALKGIRIEDINVLHGSRDNEGSSSVFRLWRTKQCAKTKKWSDKELEFSIDGKKVLKDDAGQFFSAGTGANKHRNRWEHRKSEAGNTSRSIFRALVDVIENCDDEGTGGRPQVVTLGTTGVAKPVGVFIDGERSVCGLPLGDDVQCGQIEWRDENYRFLSPSSLAKKSNAPEHNFKG